MTCREDDLVRTIVKAWREVVQPRPSVADCWRLDCELREQYGGKRVYVRKAATVEREQVRVAE